MYSLSSILPGILLANVTPNSNSNRSRNVKSWKVKYLCLIIVACLQKWKITRGLYVRPSEIVLHHNSRSNQSSRKGQDQGHGTYKP